MEATIKGLGLRVYGSIILTMETHMAKMEYELEAWDFSGFLGVRVSPK